MTTSPQLGFSESQVLSPVSPPTFFLPHYSYCLPVRLGSLWRPRRINGAGEKNLFQKVKAWLPNFLIFYSVGMSAFSATSPVPLHLWTLTSPTLFLDCAYPSIPLLAQAIKVLRATPNAPSSTKKFPNPQVRIHLSFLCSY